MNTVEVLGVKINQIDSNQLNKEVVYLVESSQKALITNVNIHCMNIAYRKPWFRKILNQAYINFCDGDGVRLGAKILNKNIIEKITYNRWIWEIASVSEQRNITWYLVGSEESIINNAVNRLRERFPKLQIVGHHHGFLKDDQINRLLIKDIKEQKPNVIITGMGMPLQEQWLDLHYNDLVFNVALTGGAVFEYVSGSAKMTPDIFYKLKLEWLFRFFQEPRRLFKRYFIGNPLFIWRVVLEKFGIIKF